MTPDQFFAKFALLSETPNAVAKMRELILDLAVSGRLLCEISTDSLVSNGTDAGIDSNSESLPNLPHYWHWAPLGRIVTRMDSGWSPACSPEPAKSDEWGVLKTTAVQVQRYLEFGNKALPSNLEPRPEHEILDGDILITRAGPTNRVGIVCVARPTRTKLMISDKIIRFHLIDAVDPDFAALALNSGFSKISIHQLKSGMAASQVNISQPKLKTVQMPIPPLAEQKRIVAKVDELMALCDQLESQQKQRETKKATLVQAALTRFTDAPTPANLEFLFHKSYAIEPAELRKTILTLAVTGRLCVADHNDKEIRQNISLRNQCLPRSQLFTLPSHWSWVILENLLIFGPTNGISPKSVDYETPVRSLTLSATSSGKFKSEHSKYIPLEIDSQSDLWLRDGDILIQRGNTIELVGVSAVYHGEPLQFVYPDLMMKIRVNESVNVDFIHLSMSSPYARIFLRDRATGTSGTMPKINQSTVKSLPIPLPPLAEQKRIVAKVEELMALVDKLEAQLAASRDAGAKLIEAVVAAIAAAA